MMMFETSKHVPKTEKRCVFKDNHVSIKNRKGYICKKNIDIRGLSSCIEAKKNAQASKIILHQLFMDTEKLMHVCA